MARLVTIGFETGKTDELNGVKAGSSVTGSWKRTGSYGFQTGAALGGEHALAADVSQIYVRLAFMMRNNDSGSGNAALPFVLYDNTGTIQCGLRYNPATQTIDAIVGGTTLGDRVAYGVTVINEATWYILEMYFDITTSGTLTLKVNGTTEFTYSGDTDPTNVGSVRKFRLGTSGSGTMSLHFDDLAINDTTGSYQNSWIGLGGIFYLAPDADGTTNDWTPSAGTVNYQMVDEIPHDSATTYNQAVTTGDIDLYGVADCPAYINTINLLEVVYYAALATSGYNQTTDLVRVGGTTYQGSERTIVPITPNYTIYYGTVHYLNPNTGSAWGTAEVNGMEAGIEITS